MIGNERGFTLIELIITIIVVSVGALGLVSALSFTTSRSIHSDLMTTANALAQERLEQFFAEKQANGYASPLLNIGMTADPPLLPPYADYARTVDICYVNSALLAPDCDPAPPNIDLGYKQVTVTVVNTRLPQGSLVSLVSLLTDY